MRILSLVVFGFLVSACGKDVTKEVEAFADRACACKEAKDAACAAKVVDDMVAFAKANQSARGDKERGAKAGMRMGQCAVEAGMSAEDLMKKVKELPQN